MAWASCLYVNGSSRGKLPIHPPYLQIIIFSQTFQVLALLEYVGRAHDIEIRPSSVRRSCRSGSFIFISVLFLFVCLFVFVCVFSLF